MKKFVLSLLMLIFLAMSCKRNQETKILTMSEVLDLYGDEIPIVGEVFMQNEPMLLNPFSIQIFGNLLIVDELMKMDDNIFSVFDLNERRYLGKFLKKGKGPGEFLGARLFPWSNDSVLAIDVPTRQSQVFSIQKIYNLDNSPDRTFIFESTDRGSQVDQCLLYDNQIVASGQFKFGAFNVYDMNGKFIREGGHFPSVNFNDEIDNCQLGYVFGPTYCFEKKDADLIAYVYHAGFSIANNKLNEIHSIIWNKPEIGEAGYKDGKPIVSQNGRGMMVGAGDLVANEKNIFFTFSKYDFFESMKTGVENEFDYILVSD
ncbi:MAG: hypothetical protein JXR82_09100 [Marinifilaceae bacterium]|nr:hypothetical protein [Marinifilaceae bacterium]